MLRFAEELEGAWGAAVEYVTVEDLNRHYALTNISHPISGDETTWRLAMLAGKL